MPKVLIGVVTHSKDRYCLDEFLESLKKQTAKVDILFVVNNGESAYTSLIKSKGFTAIEDPKKAETRIDKILNGRKYLREHALKNNYDYLMFVDSDIMMPSQAVEGLLVTKADVATGVYLNVMELDGKKVVAPVVFKDLGGGNCQLYTYEGIAPAQILEIGAAGFGCTLISRKVLEAVSLRTMGNSTTGGEDIAFYLDARAKGFKTVANTLIKCIHRPYPIDDPRAKVFEWHKRVEHEHTFTAKY